MKTMLQDLRYGLRMLCKNLGFTTAAVLTLALGIGANSASFSVVNAVLLRPLPYKHPDRLVMVWDQLLGLGFSQFWITEIEFFEYRHQSQVLEDVAAFNEVPFILTDKDEPEQIMGAMVSASLFPVLGVKAIQGRTFLPEEEQPGRDQVVVLSHSLWQGRFGSDSNVLGRKITVNGKPYTVIGIAPRDFQLPLDFQFARQTKLWVPLGLNPNSLNLRNHYLRVVARLKRGVSLEQAKAEMGVIARRLEQQYPAKYPKKMGFGVTLIPVRQQIVGNVRPAFLLLLGATGLVLLIACANVANLLLARAAVRQREIAIRVALGAVRLRLVQQLLTESMLLSILGGVLGLLLALCGTKILVALNPANIPRVGEVNIDVMVLGFTFVISLLTGVVFGLVPALQASKLDLHETLKEGDRRSTGGATHHRVRRVLVVAEVALAVLLTISAGLLIRSFWHLRQIDPGFNPHNVLAMDIQLPDFQYRENNQVTGFYQQLLKRVETLPGVQSVAVVSALPLWVPPNKQSFVIEGRPVASGTLFPNADLQVIGPDYFRTMGIPLLKGRDFTELDHEKALGVTIINEAMARRYWSDEDPIGKRIRLGQNDPWFSVVGVVGDVKHERLNTETRQGMYVPYHQIAFTTGLMVRRYMTLVVRTAPDPMSLIGAVKSQIWAMDKNLPVSNIRTMEQVLSDSVSQPRFTMLVLGIFAGVAIVLAAVGIYGVISYSVALRTHEIGIRMALGAQRSDILKLVVGQGIFLALVGVVIGLAAAFGSTRIMSSLLFGVSTTDSFTLIGVAVVITGVALVASFVPAWRATRVDPMVALRYE